VDQNGVTIDILVQPKRDRWAALRFFGKLLHTAGCKPRGAVEAVTVMFQPFGLHELFGIPTHLLTEYAVEGHSLLGCSISRLHGRMGDERSFEKRVQMLDQFLLAQRTSRKRAEDSRWHRSLAMVAQDRGLHNVRRIAASLNSSVRQLERKSLEFAGMTPQTMARVARFVHALELKQTSPGKRALTWTEIAHSSGYYHRMHLIREFRLMGGDRPTALEDQLEPHHGASLLLQRLDDRSLGGAVPKWPNHSPRQTSLETRFGLFSPTKNSQDQV
jgi:AraC-like DNA-binding protein